MHEFSEKNGKKGHFSETCLRIKFDSPAPFMGGMKGMMPGVRSWEGTILHFRMGHPNTKKKTPSPRSRVLPPRHCECYNWPAKTLKGKLFVTKKNGYNYNIATCHLAFVESGRINKTWLKICVLWLIYNTYTLTKHAADWYESLWPIDTCATNLQISKQEDALHKLDHGSNWRLQWVKVILILGRSS